MGKTPGTTGRLAFLALAGAVLLTNVLLVRQNLRLRAQLDSSPRPALEAGERAPSFTASDLYGNAVRVSPGDSDRRRVFLYLSSHCPYTDIQFPYWCELIEAADPERFEFFGLVAIEEEEEDIGQYLQTQECQLPGPLLRLDSTLREEYKLTISPTTLVVRGDGRVERVWNGIWRREDVQHALDMVAPRHSEPQ